MKSWNILKRKSSQRTSILCFGELRLAVVSCFTINNSDTAVFCLYVHASLGENDALSLAHTVQRGHLKDPVQCPGRRNSRHIKLHLMKSATSCLLRLEEREHFKWQEPVAIVSLSPDGVPSPLSYVCGWPERPSLLWGAAWFLERERGPRCEWRLGYSLRAREKEECCISTQLKAVSIQCDEQRLCHNQTNNTVRVIHKG